MQVIKNYPMPRIAGVTTQKNTRGEITHVTIDVKKHKEAITPVLYKMGVLEKTKFQKEFEKGVGVEEAFDRVLKFVRTLPWKK